MASKKPKSRTEDLVVQDANGEKLIYDLRSNKALCLNETSALVWEACDGTRDTEEIRKYVSSKLRSQANADLVWLALDQLKKEDLINAGPAVENRFEGMSRRDVIRKVGIGSMIALPIVASLIAPPAVLAQTACGTTCTCRGATTAGQVCSTTGGGTACPATPAGCGVCRATQSVTGVNTLSPGTCFTT